MTPESQSTALFLKPGEMVLSDQPVIVTTLLGSCVAVTMYSPRHRMGAICHALLPACRAGGLHCSHGHSEAGRYVECAIRLMLQELSLRGVARGEIEAKLFGGSDMFDSEGRNPTVGRQNIAMALEMLEKTSIRLVKQDLGGPRGRKIVFHMHSGEVFLKRLRKSEM